MARLIFQAADVRRIVEHSLAAPAQSPIAYTENPAEAPSVVLVHDEGVYLMSNGDPRDRLNPDQPKAFVAYAKGCDPRTDNEWWDRARDLVGGDDFAETLPWAKEMKALLDSGAKTVTIIIGPDGISPDGSISLATPIKVS